MAVPGHAGELVEVLQALLSGDNERRGTAERQYEALKKSQPVVAVTTLFQALVEPQLELPVREQAAVLLRQCLGKVNDEDSVWSQLGRDTVHQEIKAKLLQTLAQEAQDKIRRKVADCVQSLGNQLICLEEEQRPRNCEEWPELLPTLLGLVCDASKDAGARADALWTVKEMACTVWPVLVTSAAQTIQVLRTCLGDAAEAVRAAAADLFFCLVGQLEAKEDRQAFAPLTPEVFEVVAQLAQGGDSKRLRDVLEAIQSTEDVAAFFKEHVSSHLLPVLCPIAKRHADNDTRKLALEALMTIMEGAPKMVLKVPQCIEALLDVIVFFIMELDDDVEEWAKQDEDDAEDEENHKVGTNAIDRLCRSMNKISSFEQVLSVLQPAIVQLFSQQDNWKALVTGLSLLMQMVEYVDEEEMVGQMLRAVKGQLRSGHVRVRYCAFAALTLFADGQKEAVATDVWAAQLLPEFLPGFEDPCERVAVTCMSAFHYYGEAVEREDIEAFAQPLMVTLGQKLRSSPGIRRQAITCIAVIAAQIRDSFAQYYSELMPVLKELVGATIHKVEERVLLGKAFECISALADAVGREAFRADAEVITSAMIQAVQVPGLPGDDPVLEYVMAAAERMCATLKEDFLPYVPPLLPIVLTKFALAPKEVDRANLDNFEDSEEVNLHFETSENGNARVLVMTTSEIEDLQHALECVHCFVDNLGKDYGPFTQQTATALLPVFEFAMKEEIRDLAFEIWGELCKSARDGGQVAVLNDLCQEFMRRIVPKLEADSADVDALQTRAAGIAKCLKTAGPGVLGASQVEHFCTLVLKLLSESFERQKQASKRLTTDEDVAEAKGDDDDEEGLLRTAVCQMVNGLMEHHADLFVASGLPRLTPVVSGLLAPTASSEDRRVALLLVTGFFEFLGDSTSNKWQEYLPQVLENMHAEDPAVRMMANNAASMAARLPAFAPFAAATARRAGEVLSRTRARAKKKSELPAQMAADNAIAVIAEVLLHHPATVVGAEAELWSAWLAGLPCQEDEAEGVRNNKILLGLAQQQNVALLGEGGKNIPRIVSLLVDAYKTDMCDLETSEGTAQFLLGQGEARLEEYAAQFTARQKKKLLRVVREAKVAAASSAGTGR